MKKVYQGTQQKTHQAARARRRLARADQQASRQAPTPPRPPKGYAKRAKRNVQRKVLARLVADRYRSNQKVVAPQHFSFVDNTDEVSGFYNELRQKSKANARRRVFIDLQGIQRATLDAFTVLVCIVSDLHHEHRTRFMLGDITNEEVETFTVKSGFDALIRGDRPSAPRARSGSFSRKSSNRVEPEEAERQAEFASNNVFRALKASSPGGLPPWAKYKTKAAIRTLIECMSNTKGHASAHGGEHEDWWLSVYYDRAERAAEFSFVDNGVGILKSGNVSRYRLAVARINQRLGLAGTTSPRLLQDAIDGKIPSQTGQQGRGNGLPTMKLDCCDHRLLDDLVIIANDAKVEVGTGVHTVLRNGFDGTFIHWRVSDTEVAP